MQTQPQRFFSPTAQVFAYSKKANYKHLQSYVSVCQTAMLPMEKSPPLHLEFRHSLQKLQIREKLYVVASITRFHPNDNRKLAKMWTQIEKHHQKTYKQ